jgi:hypothetical protein
MSKLKYFVRITFLKVNLNQICTKITLNYVKNTEKYRKWPKMCQKYHKYAIGRIEYRD